ncbi:MULTISPECIES: acyl-CoA thioesterase [unclassified Carboxylicivirga]|uniref:acyl-CoA thioesterase n=1 Tax=Carboxylicivirga TaxID=1628153 RepID=UPI003D358263
MKNSFNISETRICKAIFPNTLNANESLFGGMALQWMDEAAYIAATRYTRQRMFTASTSDIKFLRALKPDSIAEVIARVIKADAVRLTVQVQITTEGMYHNDKQVAIEGHFNMVSLNERNRPQRIDYSITEKMTGKKPI